MMRKGMVAAMAAVVLVLVVPAMIFAANAGHYVYGDVEYGGSHTGKVLVCALLEGEDNPTGCVYLTGPGPFNLGPLPPEKYHVCAWFDFDEDGGAPKADEPVGCTFVDLTESSVRGVVIVMEDPVVEEEFVPEPGTIMLLGTGLAGLAGYATLRWRRRE